MEVENKIEPGHYVARFKNGAFYRAFDVKSDWEREVEEGTETPELFDLSFENPLLDAYDNYLLGGEPIVLKEPNNMSLLDSPKDLDSEFFIEFFKAFPRKGGKVKISKYPLLNHLSFFFYNFDEKQGLYRSLLKEGYLYIDLEYNNDRVLDVNLLFPESYKITLLDVMFICFFLIAFSSCYTFFSGTLRIENYES